LNNSNIVAISSRRES